MGLNIKEEVNKKINDLAILNYEGKIRSIAFVYLDENNQLQMNTVIAQNTELVMLAATEVLHDQIKIIINSNFKPKVE